MIRIHNFARGARGVRVYWTCEEMNLPYQIVKISYPPDDHYRALNPMETAPFLEDEGGVAINESVAIMLYLAQRYGPTPLLPDPYDPTFARVLQMTVFGEASIGMGINPVFEAHVVAPEADKRNWSVRAQEARVRRAVNYAAHILADGPYMAGAELTLADISVSSVLGMWSGALQQPLPDSLAAYRERMIARPAYQRALDAQSRA